MISAAPAKNGEKKAMRPLDRDIEAGSNAGGDIGQAVEIALGGLEQLDGGRRPARHSSWPALPQRRTALGRPRR